MERLMQYIWEHRLYPRTAMSTVDGRRVTVLDPGLLNRNAGPDFFNAKILIDRQEWVGNVEIHVRASDCEPRNCLRCRVGHAYLSSRAVRNPILKAPKP